MRVNWAQAQKKAAKTARWAVTMTKVRIRRARSRTRWQLVTFCGKAGGGSVGVVDLLAVRKEHGAPITGTKRGDNFQIILVQVKGGNSKMPTQEDATRLRAVGKRHGARHLLLASWQKGTEAKFFQLLSKPADRQWV